MDFLTRNLDQLTLVQKQVRRSHLPRRLLSLTRLPLAARRAEHVAQEGRRHCRTQAHRAQRAHPEPRGSSPGRTGEAQRSEHQV